MSAHLDLLIRAPRVVSGVRGEPEQARAIGVSNGRIEVVQPVDTPATAWTVLELGSDVVVLPGLVDPHVHVCEPGTDWEGFATATRAAAAGGVTTLVDMPVDSVPATVTAEALAIKRSAADGGAALTWASGVASFPATWAASNRSTRPAYSASNASSRILARQTSRR